LIKYPGLKEQVYLGGFKPDKTVLNELKLKVGAKIVVVRPEPFTAAYYHSKENKLLDVLDALVKVKNLKIVLIARDKEQNKFYSERYINQVIIPSKVIDVPSLICFSSLVISAGGTMNREAVVLGVPVASYYNEKLLSVDKWIVDKGYMLHMPSINEVKKLLNKKIIKKFNKKIDLLDYIS
jgi:hypothetical protein